MREIRLTRGSSDGSTAHSVASMNIHTARRNEFLAYLQQHDFTKQLRLFDQKSRPVSTARLSAKSMELAGGDYLSGLRVFTRLLSLKVSVPNYQLLSTSAECVSMKLFYDVIFMLGMDSSSACLNHSFRISGAHPLAGAAGAVPVGIWVRPRHGDCNRHRVQPVAAALLLGRHLRPAASDRRIRSPRRSCAFHHRRGISQSACSCDLHRRGSALSGRFHPPRRLVCP